MRRGRILNYSILNYSLKMQKKWKQLVALMNIWNTDYAQKENISFSEMVKRCYKSRPWHENANIIYLHKGNMKTTIVPHACYNLDEAEEEIMLGLLKKQLK